MIVNDHQRIGFAFIPRTASRSVQRALLATGQWRRIAGDHHRRRVEPTLRGYRWHVTVRNPFAREWSHYCYRLKNDPPSALKRRVRRFSFADYVLAHVGDARLWEDITQAEFCDILKPDVVLRCEDLPDCLTSLPWWPEGLELPHINAAARGDWRRQYTEETARLIRQWAAEDFQRFGYPTTLESPTPTPSLEPRAPNPQ